MLTERIDHHQTPDPKGKTYTARTGEAGFAASQVLLRWALSGLSTHAVQRRSDLNTAFYALRKPLLSGVREGVWYLRLRQESAAADIDSHLSSWSTADVKGRKVSAASLVSHLKEKPILPAVSSEQQSSYHKPIGHPLSQYFMVAFLAQRPFPTTEGHAEIFVFQPNPNQRQKSCVR